MQKLCCVRTIQQSSASLDYLSQVYQPVSPSILSHFLWELYQGPKKWIGRRHTTFQQLVYGDAALISFSGLDPINFVCYDINTIGCQSTSFQKLAVI